MKRDSWVRTGLTILWALSPLLTLGLANPFIFTHVALRLRSWMHWLAAAGYLALELVQFVPSDSASGAGTDVVFTIALGTAMLGGTAHAFAVRGRVFARRDAVAFDQAQEEIRRRRELRARAHEIARRDPQTALEMRIGRPDLPRGFDDGGLVDVNHAPAHVLAQGLGITPEQAERLVQTRERCDGFVSAEEAAALTGLPPSLTPRLAEYGVYLP
ncbi:MAG: helix-hairpin-helix domain-containing protein [Actinomadura rubrobrunea]|nr:helix-hairpin-helix domain-containing protein [Actinomadura rubrobrunea]